MATERMRLEAEMKDNASPAIAKLRKELVELQNVTRESRAIGKLNAELATLRKEAGGVRVSPGMGAVGGWFKKAGDEAAGFSKSVSGASTAFSALGIGGLATTASLSGLSIAMKNLGDRTLAIRELGREIGASTDYVNAFAHAGQSFGVGADVMESALNHLAGQMPEFKNSQGDLFRELSRWPDLIARLKKDTAKDQIKDLFDFFGQQKLQSNPQLQKKLLGMAFGNGDEMEKLFARGGKGILGEIDKQERQLGPISPEMLKQAQDFRDAQIKFTDTLERFELTIGPAFLSGMTSIVSSITNSFTMLGMLNDKMHGRSDPKNETDAAGEQNRRNIQPASPNNPFATGQMRLGHINKMGFEGGGGGLLHNASFTSGGGAFGSGADIIASGTRAGFLAAMRELAAVGETSAAGSGGGIINASLGGGSGGFAAGTGGRSAGGGYGGLGGANLSGGDAAGEHADWIRSEAKRLGIDPRVAVAVAKSEGLGTAWGSGMDHGTSFGDYQLHVGGGLGDIFRRQGGRLSPDNWKAMDTFALEHAAKNGWGPWHGAARIGVHGMAGIGGRSAGVGADLRGGDGDRMPNVPSGYSAPGHIAGQLKIGDSSYRFGSGGVRGSASIPFGDHEITPNSIGPWGKSVGAIGLDHEQMWDKTLGRMRTGIEMHLGHSANLITEGCIAFEKSQWPKVKAQALDMIKREGHAYLHVGPHGASITPNRRADGLAERDASHPAKPTGSQHQLDIRLHDRGGAVQSTSMKSSGHGLHPRLQRWPTAPGMVDA